MGAAPVVLGLLFQPVQLGSSSLETLQEGGQSSIQFSSTASGSGSSGRNLYQWAYQFANTEPSTLLGEQVDVIGFVYHGESDAADEFQVARFVVACCVADARGYTLPVRWPGASELEADTWIQVTGRIGTTADGAPIVLADTVESIEAPANPYIYP
ncbi:MAG: TIGR03943 family protein [Dehalococcoidia bacterium]|nr:TIGR03943 family protein [Dehalococcoidia bacterium]